MISRLFGEDLISTQDWSIEDLETVLDLAMKMKKDRFSERYVSTLKNRTFFMLFYNRSVRTRLSFEAAAIELGAHAQFLEPRTMRLVTKTTPGEIVKDIANVMSRYGCGIGIRILEDAIEKYGEGERLLREYAQYASIPVISMAHDKGHPCQGLADLMALRERLGKDLRGKKLAVVWARGALVRSWASVQEHLLITSRFGMNICLAYPKGYHLDPMILETVQSNARAMDSNIELTHDLTTAYKDADVVFSRNWMSPHRYDTTREQEIEQARKHSKWTCTKQLMALTNNACFIHPMPVERGAEVADEVVDSPQSLIYEVAENRIHVQKAIMALTMGQM